MLTDIKTEFRRHQQLAEAALAHLDDAAFFHKPGEPVNPLALIVKHVAGNLRSRWTDFLTTDGDKPGRNRDGEFQILAGDSRERLMNAWQQGWAALVDLGQPFRTGLRPDRHHPRRTFHGAASGAPLPHAHCLSRRSNPLRRPLAEPRGQMAHHPPGQSRNWSGKYLPEQDQEKTKKP